MNVDACRASIGTAVSKTIVGDPGGRGRPGEPQRSPEPRPRDPANPATFNLELYLKHMVFASQAGPFCWASRPLRRVLCWRAQSQADPSGPQLQGQKLLSDSAPFTKLFFVGCGFPLINRSCPRVGRAASLPFLQPCI